MDLNYDEKCQDLLYRRRGVSGITATEGHGGLFNPTSGFDTFQLNGGVMVWSFGPITAHERGQRDG